MLISHFRLVAVSPPILLDWNFLNSSGDTITSVNSDKNDGTMGIFLLSGLEDPGTAVAAAAVAFFFRQKFDVGVVEIHSNVSLAYTYLNSCINSDAHCDAWLGVYVGANTDLGHITLID
ncbi:hypothetical protein [Neobacillus drentensis]|uniref:hypothetical protein n=1 Tax=Neobacillus drentensis TaxID=220684 RepID=UPI002FFF50B5